MTLVFKHHHLTNKNKGFKNLVFVFVQSKQLQCDDNNYLGVPAVVAVEEIDATTTA